MDCFLKNYTSNLFSKEFSAVLSGGQEALTIGTKFVGKNPVLVELLKHVLIERAQSERGKGFASAFKM